MENKNRNMEKTMMFPKPLKKEKKLNYPKIASDFSKKYKKDNPNWEKESKKVYKFKLSPIRKTVTKTKAKKKAWDAFSLWVRISNIEDQSPMAEVACYTCGRWKNYKEMSAGHGIGGRNNQILFDERLVKPQCAGCNIFGRGQYPIFISKLIAELGSEVVVDMIQHSRDVKPMKVADYEQIEKEYKWRVEALQNE